MTTKWEDDGRRAVMQEFAEDAESAGNRERALALIRRVMQSVRCPPGAVIEEYVPAYAELPIWLD